MTAGGLIMEQSAGYRNGDSEFLGKLHSSVIILGIWIRD